MHPVLVPSIGTPDRFRPDVPRQTLAHARAYVSDAVWTFAATMPWVPHWYCTKQRAVRDGAGDGYDALRDLIIGHHYIRSWHGRSFRTVDLGGLSLWIMQDGLIVINAKPAADAGWDDTPSLFDNVG